MTTQNIKNTTFTPREKRGPYNSSTMYDQKLYDINGNEYGTITYISVQLFIEKKESNNEVINWLKRTKMEISINFNSIENLDTCVVQLCDTNNDNFYDLIIKSDKKIVDGNNQDGYSMKLLKTTIYGYNLTFSLKLPTNGQKFISNSVINFKFLDSKKNLKLNIMSNQIKIFSSYKNKKRNHENSSVNSESKKQKTTITTDSSTQMIPTYTDLYNNLNKIGQKERPVLCFPYIIPLFRLNNSIQIIPTYVDSGNKMEQKETPKLCFPDTTQPILSCNEQEVTIISNFETTKIPDLNVHQKIEVNIEPEEIDLNIVSDDEIDLNACYDD
jgi:hypothetical protein